MIVFSGNRVIRCIWGRVMRKRKNGEGSYGEKTINGFKYRYYRAPYPDMWEVYARTARELEEKKKKKEKEIRQKNTANDPQVKTFVDLCYDWLKTVLNKISPKTYDDYEHIIDKRIKGDESFAKTQASCLTVDMINAFLNRLALKYSKGSIDKTWVVIKQAILYGQDEGIIGDMNLRKIEKPRERDVAVKKKEVQYIDLNDMELLYKEANRENGNGTAFYGRAAKVIIFIMYSGVRLSEALGLKWKYVSENMDTVMIQQSMSRVMDRDDLGNVIFENGQRKHKSVIKDPKTESGVRTIPLPERAKEVIKFFSGLYPDHSMDDYVFLNSLSNPYQHRTVERTLDRMLKNSDCRCKEYTPHSLRHGYGSILLSKGVDIKTVSKLLGHKDITTTYNIYIHVLEEDKIKAIKKVFDD